MTRFFIPLLFLLSFSIYGQNLKGVDTIVLNYKKFENIEDLSDKIKTDFHSDIERVRAIYTWMANNIRYNNHHLRLPNRIIYTSQKDLKEQIKNQIKISANFVFNSQKGICYDYASLFYILCENLAIKSEIIHGFAKTKVTAIELDYNPKLYSNHAWNKVYIDNNPYLIDATWSLTIIPNKNGYIKDINYNYFLTNPYLFILDHYPENYKDSLIKDVISELSFINYPKVHLNNYKNVRLIRPIKSKINRKIKTNTQFTFQVIKPVKEVSFYLGDKFHYNVPYRYKENILTFDLDLENTNESNLTLFINNKAICSYWVE